MGIDDKDKTLLARICVSGWHVNQNNILDLARMMERGWVTVEDEYDMISVRATDEGTKIALDLGLIQKCTHPYGEWEYTDEWRATILAS